MPKAKRPGNQHNNRHENGSVAPGKRITRQKSNGHLNGSVEGASHANSVPLPALPTARTTLQEPENSAPGPNALSDDIPNSLAKSGNSHLEGVTGPLELLPTKVNHANGSLSGPQRKMDIDIAKSSIVHGENVFRLALTILRSCPLGDTLTILILLLSLPTTLLSITNALFAVLTFMPPAGSFSSLPSTFNDIFAGSGGTPSLATIVLTDIIGLILWLVTWAPVQVLAIELTQAVVATTLGGGSTSEKSGHDSTLLCMGIVAFHHVARNGWIPQRIFGFDWSAILSSIPYVPKDRPSFIRISNDTFTTTRSAAGWLRVLIALHILIQGLVHMARRWYQRRDYFQPAHFSKRTDPEAVADSPIVPGFSSTLEAGGQNYTTSATNTPTKPTSTTSKDAREKVSNSKRKRKQGTYVRSQQPLWAAFAATKVTVLREYEQTHSQSESAAAKATDPKSLGNTPFSVEDRLWISEVHPDSFVFHTVHFPHCSFEANSENPTSPGIDKSKPLYVRINDTDWTSTYLDRNKEDESVGEQWTGEVFGLSPSSSYRCSFLQSEDGVVVYSVTLTTPPSLTAEKEPSVFATASSRVHRPSSPTSPTTTLKKSICAFESNLGESLARQRRSKKDIKVQSTALKKDIDIFNARISKLGSEDRAHLNRHLQWNQHTRQADEAVSSIASEIESMGYVPEDEIGESRNKRASWDEARTRQTSTRERLFRGKEAVHREKASVRGDATTTQQKRERLVVRNQKLMDQHNRLVSATIQGLDDQDRRDSEQEEKELEHAQAEARASEQISSYHRAFQESRYLIQQHWSQAQVIESAFHEQQMLSSAPSEDRPLTPEGDLPGENPNNAVSSSFRFPAFGTPESSTGLRSHSGSLRQNDNRPRSISMLSGNSVYIDFDDQDPAPPMPARAVETIRAKGRQQSGGSNGGSSGSTSQHDPASPAVSPIGQKSPVWNP